MFNFCLALFLLNQMFILLPFIVSKLNKKKRQNINQRLLKKLLLFEDFSFFLLLNISDMFFIEPPEFSYIPEYGRE